MVRPEGQETTLPSQGFEPSDPTRADSLLERGQGGSPHPQPKGQTLHGRGGKVQAAGT